MEIDRRILVEIKALLHLLLIEEQITEIDTRREIIKKRIEQIDDVLKQQPEILVEESI